MLRSRPLARLGVQAEAATLAGLALYAALNGWWAWRALRWAVTVRAQEYLAGRLSRTLGHLCELNLALLILPSRPRLAKVRAGP